MAEPLILVERDQDVAILTFNDPQRLNAMSQAMGEAFAAQVATLSSDDALRAVVLTGAGRAFSAGGDLAMIQQRADEGAAAPGIARRGIRDSMHSFYKLFLAVRDLPCPTIAAINGAAVGAGFCVALACDVRIASCSGDYAVGDECAVDQPDLRRLFAAEHQELANEFASNAPAAVRSTKRALARSLDATLEDQLSFEAHEQAICFETQDAQEGIAAAKERRSPRFTGT